MVTGYLKPDSGSIALDGMDIGGQSPRNVARLGISRSFQIPQLFIELTAAENLAVALSGMRAHALSFHAPAEAQGRHDTVSYTHLRAHETDSYLVCRLLLEKKKNK